VFGKFTCTDFIFKQYERTNVYYFLAPRAVDTIAKVFRPITPQILLDLTTVFGHDTNEWKPYLLEFMNEDQIPRGFAGANSLVVRG